MDANCFREGTLAESYAPVRRGGMTGSKEFEALDATETVHFFCGRAPAQDNAIHFTGTVAGAPLSFTKNTRNLARFVLLAFLETV